MDEAMWYDALSLDTSGGFEKAKGVSPVSAPVEGDNHMSHLDALPHLPPPASEAGTPFPGPTATEEPSRGSSEETTAATLTTVSVARSSTSDSKHGGEHPHADTDSIRGSRGDDGVANAEEEDDDDEDSDQVSVIIHDSEYETSSTWHCRRQSCFDTGVSETEVEQLTNESAMDDDDDGFDDDDDDTEAVPVGLACGLFTSPRHHRRKQKPNTTHDSPPGKDNDGRFGAHKRVRVEIMKDIARLGDNVMRTSAKKGQSMLTQMSDWLSCILGSSSKGDDSNDGFDINFEKIKQLKYIGSGAQGCVYLGTYKGEEVAVKKVKELGMTTKAEDVLRSLKHENIIELVGVCKTPPVYAVVMEYCPKSLYDVLQTRHLPPSGIVNWAAQIARGMQYLHDNGIVHRDLKSPNILLGPDKATLKISDFGCCREYRHGRSVTMSFSGTAAWMAPEIIRSESCTEHVDVWSYGVVLWELLTREIPYKGVDAHAIVWGVGNAQLHLPVPSGTPDGLQLLLQQCWDQTPKNRPCFKMVLKMLDVLATTDKQFAAMSEAEFETTQREWRQEITAKFAKMKQLEQQRQFLSADLVRQRNEELQHAQEIRQLLEQRLDEVTKLLYQMRKRKRDRRERRRRGRHTRSGSRDMRRPRMPDRAPHNGSDAGSSVERLQRQLEQAVGLGDDVDDHEDTTTQA